MYSLKFDLTDKVELGGLVYHEIKRKEEFRLILGDDLWRELGHHEDILRLKDLLKRIEEARHDHTD